MFPPLVHSIVEIIGWCVVVVVVGFVLIALTDQLLYLLLRRRFDFIRLWRIGFYAGDGRTIPCYITLRQDHSEWVSFMDRWYWRVSSG